MPISRRTFLADGTSVATLTALNPTLTAAAENEPVSQSRQISQSDLTLTRKRDRLHIVAGNGITLELRSAIVESKVHCSWNKEDDLTIHVLGENRWLFC